MRIYYKVMTKGELGEGYVQSNGSTEFKTKEKAIEVVKDYENSIFAKKKNHLIIEKHTVTETVYGE